MENSTNAVDLGGRIASGFEFSHSVYGEGFYNLSLEVERLSGATDILPITVSERIVDTTLMTIGVLIRVNGQIRSYNSYVEADKKNKLVLTVFARDIVIVDELPENSPNEIYLDGYLCKPAVYRTTPFGREIADLLVAVNRSYSKSDYIPCIAWGRNARYTGRLGVGHNVRIWGRMQSRRYQKKLSGTDVIEKTAYEVSVSKVEVVD